MKKTLLFVFALFFTAGKMAAQCVPQLLQCATEPVTNCDLSPNAPLYWNDALWWDNINQSHDIAETAVDLQFSYRDTCGLSGLSVRCLLYLDLGDGPIQETLVDTDNPPDAGTVNFGSATGIGVPRDFDNRPVPMDQKWRFALQFTQAGDTVTASLRWNTEASPGVFVLPELALGVHKVRWELRDGAGILAACEYTLRAKDCLAPSVTCLNGLSINIGPAGTIQLWTTDFLQQVVDNVTPAPLTTLGIRKVGTGSGFPVDGNGNPITTIFYDCSELSTQPIELWAIDAVGNADYCSTSLMVNDDHNHCDGLIPGLIKVCSRSACGGVALEFSNLQISYTQQGDTVQVNEPLGCGDINQQLPDSTEVTFTPSNGFSQEVHITTYDLVIIGQHLSGQDLFDEPYQFIAADANRDGVLNSLDIETCTNHILGIEPISEPWRFIDKSFVSPWPADPLSVFLPGAVTVSTSSLPANGVEFVVVGLCNVTCGNLVEISEQTADDQHLIGVPQPNPTKEGAVLPLQLTEAETVFFELMDVSGKRLFEQIISLPAGNALLDIPALSMPEQGIYLWRIRAGEVLKSGKIVHLCR